MNVCPSNADVFINDDKIKIVTEFTGSKSQFLKTSKETGENYKI